MAVSKAESTLSRIAKPAADLEIQGLRLDHGPAPLIGEDLLEQSVAPKPADDMSRLPSTAQK